MEDVVAQNEADAVVADEIFTDKEGLGQTVGRRLLSVGEVDAKRRAVAEKTAETGQVFGRRDNKYVADAGKHEGRDGIIDHRLVENGDKLFAYAFGDGIEARTATSGQDYSFHERCFLMVWRLQPAVSVALAFVRRVARGERAFLRPLCRPAAQTFRAKVIHFEYTRKLNLLNFTAGRGIGLIPGRRVRRLPKKLPSRACLNSNARDGSVECVYRSGSPSVEYQNGEAQQE